MKKIEIPEYNLQEKIKRNVYALVTGAKEIIKPGTITTHYPKERKRMPDNFRGYILFDIEKCISCFQCAFVCPANAIWLKEAPNRRYYPTIDYAKCIFCHFCVDSCSSGALKPTKILDVAYKDIEEMHTLTEEMIEKPEMIREDKSFVEYVIEAGEFKLERKEGVDNLFVEAPPPKKVELVSECIDPKSCLADGRCVEVCESEAISLVRDEERGIVRVVIDKERCNGCGLCVKECPMQILRLARK
ncbi:MAG: 4Fe-4S binding protein, partial [Candidatus Methanospirareceae archaeon]